MPAFSRFCRAGGKIWNFPGKSGKIWNFLFFFALAIHLSLTLILLTLHNYCFTAYAVSTLNIMWSDFLELCHCVKWIFQQSVKTGLWFSNFNLTFQKIFQCYVLITELLYRTAKRKKRKLCQFQRFCHAGKFQNFPPEKMPPNPAI